MGAKGNQALGFLQSVRYGDRLSSQAETFNGVGPGVTFIVVRKQNVRRVTHTYNKITRIH